MGSTRADKPTQLDGIAADAAPPPEYPPGCPTLLPVLALPRARRADYYDRIAEVARQQHAADPVAASDPDAAMEVKASEAAGMMRLLASIEELLAVVAADESELRAWAAAAADTDVAQAFNVYMRRTQPGEASSSAS